MQSSSDVSVDVARHQPQGRHLPHVWQHQQRLDRALRTVTPSLQQPPATRPALEAGHTLLVRVCLAGVAAAVAVATVVVVEEEEVAMVSA